MIAYIFSEGGERRGKEEEMGQEERRENMREERGEGRGKTHRSRTTFPHNHSVQSTVVVSPSAWSPRQLSWILMHASHTTTHIYYK